ncbi:MAG: hypothetical protein P4M11_03040 [Candidatus Pacebacteria bacterium]|nr:hypothetical protein [Candidatus Paceibacterota bacterium]
MLDSLCRQRALRVNGIPRNMVGRAHEEQLKAFFEEIVGEGEVITAKIIVDYGETYTLILRKNEVLEKLERAKKANMRSAERETIRKGICCCKQYVDAESEYTRQLEHVQAKEERLKFSESEKTNIGSAFVIFKSPEKAYEAKRIVSRKFRLAPRYSHLGLQDWGIAKAPMPSDIVWENMGINAQQRLLLFLLLNIPLLFLTALTVVPIAVLNELANIAEILNQKINISDTQISWGKAFIDNYFPPLLLYVHSSLLVPFLIYCVARYERSERKSHLEKSILAKNFVFMLFDTIILPSFGLTTMYTLFEQHNWYHSPVATNHRISDLPSKVVLATPILLKYLLQYTFISNGIQLLALPQLVINRLRELIYYVFSSDQKEFAVSPRWCDHRVEMVLQSGRVGVVRGHDLLPCARVQHHSAAHDGRGYAVLLLQVLRR